MSPVDVIMPCYRYAHFLRKCVRVLILDDASPDERVTHCDVQ